MSKSQRQVKKVWGAQSGGSVGYWKLRERESKRERQ